MPLDANGIWQFTEGDLISPASTMLNKLAGSTSSKAATLGVQITALQDLAGGIGVWQPYTPSLSNFLPGASIVSGRWCRIGKTVFVRGQVLLASGLVFNSSKVVCNVPTALSGTIPGGDTVGNWTYRVAGVGYYYGPATVASATGVEIGVSASAPKGSAPSPNDAFFWNFSYEAA